MQAEIFLQALKCAVEILGDWHMGLNMLTLIYNLYTTMDFSISSKIFLGGSGSIKIFVHIIFNHLAWSCLFTMSWCISLYSSSLQTAHYLILSLIPIVMIYKLTLICLVLNLYAQHAPSSCSFWRIKKRWGQVDLYLCQLFEDVLKFQWVCYSLQSWRCHFYRVWLPKACASLGSLEPKQVHKHLLLTTWVTLPWHCLFDLARDFFELSCMAVSRKNRKTMCCPWYVPWAWQSFF